MANEANLTNRSGRPPGYPNKVKKADLMKACQDANYDPIAAMLAIAQGELECLVCRGEGEARYPVTDGNGNRMREENGALKLARRLCESCYGTGYEHMHVADLLKARVTIFDKLIPSLKQVDHSSEDGSMRPIYAMQIIDSSGRVVTPPGHAPNGEKVPPQLMQKRDE